MVGAVIVAYKPNLDRLKLCYNSLKKFNVEVLLVLNSDYVIGLNFIDQSDLLVLGDNVGIAAASNIGAKVLLENRGVEWLIFSDQDTVFPDEYFTDLFKEISKDCVNMLAPKYYDEVSASIQMSMVQRFGKRVFLSDELSGVVYQVIASGLAIRSSLFFELKGFREDLFIDWVDMELCWRAYKTGVRLKLMSASLSHRLGDSSVTLFGAAIPIRSGLRYYYLIRNGLYLGLRFNHGSSWINIWFLRKVLHHLVGYAVLSIRDRQKLLLILKGFIHGIQGKLGRL